MFKDFLAFLKQYGILGLAIGVIMGDQINAVEKALVDDVLMPSVSYYFFDGDWRDWTIGDRRIKIGHLLGTLIDFVIVTLTVFLILKVFYFNRKEPGGDAGPPASPPPGA